MKLIQLIVLALIYSNSLISQNTLIRGYIFDSLNLEPIPYSHIYFDLSHGSVSNLEGIFLLNLNNSNNAKDSLKISCIGYKSKKISIDKIDLESVNKIYLSPLSYNLEKVSIYSSKTSPYELLQSALDSFKYNYLSQKKYYHCSYLENIQLMFDNDKNKDSSSRTVKSEFILETNVIKRIRTNYGLKIDEKIYFINIDKGDSKLAFEDKVEEPNYLKFLINNNFLNYKKEVFNSPKKYKYTIQNTYYDSTFKKNVIELGIREKDSLNNIVYVSMFITSGRHQIIKVHEKYLYSNLEDEEEERFKNSGIYQYSDYESLLIFKINDKDKLEFNYLHEFYNNSFYDDVNDKINYRKNVFTKINVIELIENGEKVIEELPEMQYDKNIYLQDIGNN